MYRLVAELQQLVSEPVRISNEFLQRLFKTDSFFKDLITAVHTHGVGRLEKKKKTVKRLCEVLHLKKS